MKANYSEALRCLEEAESLMELASRHLSMLGHGGEVWGWAQADMFVARRNARRVAEQLERDLDRLEEDV